MAGPLGEMFDHGCDAMNTTVSPSSSGINFTAYILTRSLWLQLEVIITCHALNLGRSWWTVASQAATLSNFYLCVTQSSALGQTFRRLTRNTFDRRQDDLGGVPHWHPVPFCVLWTCRGYPLDRRPLLCHWSV